jgi:hypothetical protein
MSRSLGVEGRYNAEREGGFMPPSFQRAVGNAEPKGDGSQRGATGSCVRAKVNRRCALSAQNADRAAM